MLNEGHVAGWRQPQASRWQQVEVSRVPHKEQEDCSDNEVIENEQVDWKTSGALWGRILFLILFKMCSEKKGKCGFLRKFMCVRKWFGLDSNLRGQVGWENTTVGCQSPTECGAEAERSSADRPGC